MDKSKWCDMDYVRDYVEKKAYVPKTDMENLINMVILSYDGELEDKDAEFYAIEDKRESPLNLMINIEDLDAYVFDCGGLKEFDYYS